MVFNDDREPPCRTNAGVKDFPACPIAVPGYRGIFRNSHYGQFVAVELLVFTAMFPSLLLQNNRPAEPVLDCRYELSLLESQRDHPLFRPGVASGSLLVRSSLDYDAACSFKPTGVSPAGLFHFWA